MSILDITLFLVFLGLMIFLHRKGMGCCGGHQEHGKEKKGGCCSGEQNTTSQEISKFPNEKTKESSQQENCCSKK